MTSNRARHAACALSFAVAACAQPSVQPPSPVAVIDTVYVMDTVRIETPSEVDSELEDQVARLQIQLVERDVVIEELERQLDATRQEVVRNLARLQTHATRAEAASGMAEAEIAIEALASLPGGEEFPEYQRANARLEESTEEFGSENFGGALYLATQARSLAVVGQRRLGADSGSRVRADETLFALPIPLQTVSRSNVREGPGLEYDVLFTVDGDVDLRGQSHTHQWLRVTDSEGREGWIFHTLVTGRNQEP